MTTLKFRASAVAAAAVLLVLPASAGWAAASNSRPDIPTSLAVGGVACAPGGILIGTTTPQITGYFADPDVNQAFTPEFAVWPAGKPAQRSAWSTPERTYSGMVFTAIPETLVNGARYHLVARATDAAGAVSRWSAVCTFTVDTIRPRPPVVNSVDYPAGTPSGGPGIPGKFTLAVAGGDSDVVKFRYSSSGTGPNEVPVGRNGLTTIELTPGTYGWNVLTVQAIDRNGNVSAETSYTFIVIDHEPKILDRNPDAGAGEPRTVQLSSSVPGTTSFTYRLNDGPATTVAADAGGAATVTVTPDRRGANILTVTSRTADGIASPEARVNLYVRVRVPRPAITSPDFPNDGTPPPSAGQQVTIYLRTDSPQVAEFVYSLNFGETEQVIAADEKGNATVIHTTTGVYLEVAARARTADGFESDTTVTGWELTPEQ